MKKNLFIVIVILFSIALITILYRKRQVTFPENEKTTFKVSKTILDMGVKKEKIPVVAKYTFYNTGKFNLYIKNIEPDCNCTVANYSKNAIKPKDSVVVKLQYNAESIGYFQSSAVVTTNSIDPATLLIFRGEIIY